MSVPPPHEPFSTCVCVKRSAPMGNTSHYMANYRCFWCPSFLSCNNWMYHYTVIRAGKKTVLGKKLACASVTKPIWSFKNFSSKVSLRSVKISAHMLGLFRWNLNVITYFSFRISIAAISILNRVLICRTSKFTSTLFCKVVCYFIINSKVWL